MPYNYNNDCECERCAATRAHLPPATPGVIRRAYSARVRCWALRSRDSAPGVRHEAEFDLEIEPGGGRSRGNLALKLTDLSDHTFVAGRRYRLVIEELPE